MKNATFGIIGIVAITAIAWNWTDDERAIKKAAFSNMWDAGMMEDVWAKSARHCRKVEDLSTMRDGVTDCQRGIRKLWKVLNMKILQNPDKLAFKITMNGCTKYAPGPEVVPDGHLMACMAKYYPEETELGELVSKARKE